MAWLNKIVKTNTTKAKKNERELQLAKDRKVSHDSIDKIIDQLRRLGSEMRKLGEQAKQTNTVHKIHTK